MFPVPDRAELLRSYNEWLFYGRLLLMPDIYPGIKKPHDHMAFVQRNTLASHYHFPLYNSGLTWETVPSPATRALAVLQVVGMDFRPLEERV